MLYLFCLLFADPRKVRSFTVARKIEEKYQIPVGLLEAIVRVESAGHPYAVYCAKRCYFFKTKQAAIKKVKLLTRQGYKNINVGCAQINLQFHRSGFVSLDSWFVPERNIEYGAKYLVQLYKQFGSWYKAVCYYHSGLNAQFYDAYIQKVNRYFIQNLEEI